MSSSYYLPAIKLSDQKWEQKIRSIHIEKNAQRLNVVSVNRHTIETDGSWNWSLFKRKDSE
jgi:hypothetical protein